MPKIVDAYQRPSRDDRGFGSIYCASLGGSAGDPAAPCEPDDDGGDCAADNSPKGRLHFRRKFHFVRLPIFEEKLEFLFTIGRHPPDDRLIAAETAPNSKTLTRMKCR